jgi:hypothetical protein
VCSVFFVTFLWLVKITSSILNPQSSILNPQNEYEYAYEYEYEYEYEYDDGDDIAHHFSEEQHSALVLADEQRESKECATKKNKEKKKSVHPIIFFTERHGFVHLNNKRRKEREIWRRVYDAHSF